MRKNIDFYFERISKDFYFISNESGRWLIVGEKEFKNICLNKMEERSFFSLKEKNFILDNLNLKKYFLDKINLNRYIYSPTSLHIIVLTLRCNHRCVYCRAVNSGEYLNTNMSLKTAFKTVDFIFSTPNSNLSIEFQGGECLLNWEVLERAVEYIISKNKKFKKNIQISVVTNLSLMNEEKMDFLISKNVAICTSLDGPEKLHNKNRLYFNGSSYALTVKWLKKIFKRIEGNRNGAKDSLPSALMTTTRYSLPYWWEIIEEYRNIGFNGIFIRPLSPIGFAKKVWPEIGYTSDEFLKFYEKVLDYVLYLNLKGIKFVERNAAIKLKKLLFCQDPNFLDLRSPCGAGIGQLAYNFDGSIYTCDEGRMVGATGDYIFKAGNVFEDDYRRIIGSQAVRLCLQCSLLENYPLCSKCAFKPYCGVCPVYNYETTGNTVGNMVSSQWCEIEKGIFKILVKRLMNKKFEEIFRGWFENA